MSDSDRKTFLLCVGAHKAGTTWVHRYLEQHENVDFGFAKEYHVFDALTLPEGELFFRRYLDFAAERLGNIKRELNDRQPKIRSIKKNIFKMVDFLADCNNYFDYFSGLLGQDEVLLTGDITPAYCSLEPRTLEIIRDGFGERGVAVKALFLLRDPVERCISASQYNVGRWAEKRGASTTQIRDYDKLVRRDYKKFGFEERARYDLTMGNLESVFDKSDIHYEFYEKLFAADSVNKISDYLGLTRREVDLGQRVNESKMKFVVSDALRAELFAHYAPVYNFMYERFSKAFIDSLWTSDNSRGARV